MESLFSILLSEENVHGDEVCLRLTDDSEEETEETSAEGTDNLKCLECVQSFLTSEELKNHKESKEHVLKLRRSRSRVVQQIRDSTLNRHQMIERSDSSERDLPPRH
ncbi:uncharacterized protein LOC126740097 isoform X4 [Anthonomus grandis grandis]|uniref:uncharacterized protein LOC126740097 isoform X4 n=1 Tax=Anthonomus grandis grandis TaxID=2921223 RepID=UPI0021652E43|nr:uncharacterized protein LOC126740097 isoform X4 [Anthonomus grandis grandis]